MIATTKINMDLAARGVTPVVYAVQNDRYSRNLMLRLFDDQRPWPVPAGVNVISRYRKPDGTCGEYDTMPDGTAAWSRAGNSVTVKLAPQVLTVAGAVQFAVTLIDGDRELSTFTVRIEVELLPGLNAGSEDYFNRSDVVPASGWAPDKYLATDADGNVVAVDAPDVDVSVEVGIDEVLAAIPRATNIAVVKTDASVTYTTTLDDGGQSVSVVTLDSNGYPSKVVTDGVACSVSWEGFDDIALGVWEGGSY